jgi:hypothetical protein
MNFSLITSCYYSTYNGTVVVLFIVLLFSTKGLLAIREFVLEQLLSLSPRKRNGRILEPG